MVPKDGKHLWLEGTSADTFSRAVYIQKFCFKSWGQHYTSSHIISKAIQMCPRRDNEFFYPMVSNFFPTYSIVVSKLRMKLNLLHNIPKFRVRGSDNVETSYFSIFNIDFCTSIIEGNLGSALNILKKVETNPFLKPIVIIPIVGHGHYSVFVIIDTHQEKVSSQLGDGLTEDESHPLSNRFL